VLVDAARYVQGNRQQDLAGNGKDGFCWIGLVEPTRDELLAIEKHITLNDFAVEDAVTNHQRPKIDKFDEHTFIVVRTIAYSSQGESLSIGDLCIFLAEDAIITVRHGEAMPLATIRTDLEAHPERIALGPTKIAHEIIDRLVDQYIVVMNQISEDVREIEDSVFDDDVPATPQDMYAVKRELIEFRRAAAPLLEPLTQLANGQVPFVNDRFRFDFSDIRDHLLRVLDQADALDRIMDAALQANLSLISVKQNEDMRKISAWVGIAAVPTMIAGIYGMNFENMPELRQDWGYFAVVGLMAVVSFSLHRLFRKNKWL
jgi:magnesium transporter